MQGPQFFPSTTCHASLDPRVGRAGHAQKRVRLGLERIDKLSEHMTFSLELSVLLFKILLLFKISGINGALVGRETWVGALTG